MADKDAVLLKLRTPVLVGRLPPTALLVTVVEAAGAVEITEAVEDAVNRDAVSGEALAGGRVPVDKVNWFAERFDVEKLPLDQFGPAKFEVTLPEGAPCRVEFELALALLPLCLVAPEVGETEKPPFVG